MGRLSNELVALLVKAIGPRPPRQIGIAVSGGGDSMALLHLMHRAFQDSDTKLRAVSVDHGLRPEAGEEARMVGALCAQLGVGHDILVWQDWDGKGNLQGEARNARYGLMKDWAEHHGIDTIAVGHTADDQAETVLMALARHSGVDGLAGMIPKTIRGDVIYVRPLLRARRDQLRAYLRRMDVAWCEDPSNEDTSYERIRARKTLEVLAPLGIDAAGLAEVGEHMRLARRALNWQTYLAARDCAKVDAGAILILQKGMLMMPKEIRRRLMARALSWVSGRSDAPRGSAVIDLLDNQGLTSTLHGCQIEIHGPHLVISREPHAVRAEVAAPGALWDGRWRMVPQKPVPVDPTFEIRALGAEGLRACPDWRETGRSETVLRASPALWQRQSVVAAPLAGVYGDWRAEIVDGEDSFFAALLAQ